MERVVFSVFAPNAKVLNYHRRCGARQTGTKTGYFVKRGVSYDAHWFEIDRETFFNRKKPLLEKMLYGEARA